MSRAGRLLQRPKSLVRAGLCPWCFKPVGGAAVTDGIGRRWHPDCAANCDGKTPLTTERG